MAKAERVFHQRIDYADGSIVEMVIWRTPSPVPPSVHGLKYSLFYGRPGVREVGHDNERGKGDHRHWRGSETAYDFSTVDRLLDGSGSPRPPPPDRRRLASSPTVGRNQRPGC